MSGAEALGSRAARRWLLVGALGGLALAAAALLRRPAPSAPAPAAGGDVVAWVNGEPIARESFARFVGAVARERSHLELDRDTRRELLQRLIDEELLLQQGLALGLERREPTARRAIVSAVVEGITTDEDPAEASRDRLEAFYAEHGRDFAQPGPVEVHAARVEVAPGQEGAAYARAVEISRRARAGEPFPDLAASLGSPIEPPLPTGQVPLDALAARVGSAVAQAVGKLAPGAVDDPVRAEDGWWVVQVVARGPDVIPPLDQVLEPVRNAYRMQQHDQRLARRLAELRARADIRIVDGDLAGP
jgi:hypothetical protein